jgi:predicted PurR-regulated permease PerM
MSNHDRKPKLREVSESRAWWLVTTAIAVALILGLGTLEVIRLLARPLAVFIFGLTLATAFAPLVSQLERRMPRVPATILVYLMLAIVLAILIQGIVPALAAQVQELANRLPDFIQETNNFINQWKWDLGGDPFLSGLLSQMSGLGTVLLRLPITITSGLLIMVLVLFISFYVLLEAAGIQGFFLSLFAEEERPRAREVMGKMAQAMGGYIRGVIINGVIVGFVTFLGLLVLGVNFALVFGVMAGLLELLPAVGPTLATVVIVGLTLLQTPSKALTALIFMVVLQQLENHILVPNIMRSQTNVSPLLSILALFTGGAIGGLMGAIIAIPIAAALQVLVQEMLAPAIRKQTKAEPVEESS